MLFSNDLEIEHAVNLLISGKLIIFPTETVYGLGADATNPFAILNIYKTKIRPLSRPIIIHLSHNVDLEFWVTNLSIYAKKLIDTFWPGPLTLILKYNKKYIKTIANAGQDRLGLRCPSHPIAQSILSIFSYYKGKNNGIAATSANLFRNISPTTIEHAKYEFGNKIYSINGGACSIGIESTILDLSGNFPLILRNGHITAKEIANTIGEMPKFLYKNIQNYDYFKKLRLNYFTKTPITLLKNKKILKNLSKNKNKKIAFISQNSNLLSFSDKIHIISAPNDPNIYANKIYSLLRSLDNDINIKHIFIDPPPNTNDWIAINDKLNNIKTI